VRLVGSRDTKEKEPRYVALSYCWGEISPKSPWLTTKHRLPEFKKEIPTYLLPRTILEAVQTTREIGERYLWVDSLCIVQDDAEDWNQQAQIMGDLYTGALCTLVSSTNSSTAGLFIGREALKASAAKISLESRSFWAISQKITLFPRLPHYDFRANAPVTSRGWCLQEELLSPRKVYFTPHGFVWECLCKESEQWKEKGINTAGDTVKHSYSAPLYRASTALTSNPISKEWSETIQEYTSRKLTYHKDVFPALNGIAKQLQRHYRFRYIDGLWSNDIHTGLLWQASGASERPTEYLAPSWPWLSVKGSVIFRRGCREESSRRRDHRIPGYDCKWRRVCRTQIW
jgi:hypothetical protein